MKKIDKPLTDKQKEFVRLLVSLTVNLQKQNVQSVQDMKTDQLIKEHMN